MLCIAEGFATAATIHEATGYAVVVAFSAGNLLAVAQALRETYPDQELRLCADDDYQTDGNPGKTKATEAAQAVGASLALPEFGHDRPEGATDFNDLRDHVLIRAAVQNARPVSPPHLPAQPDSADVNPAETETVLQAATRLATLSPLEYDRVRGREAKTLGVRPGTLDTEVKKLRTQNERVSDVPFDEVVPWDDPVNAKILLSEIASTIRRFVVCDAETVHAATLIIAMTWLIDVVKVAPLAVITAPEMACGKSRLLEVMARLVQRPLTASNITPAAMFRCIDAWRPTLLIDETDTFLKENEELRGILNAGHTRATAYVVRVVGDEFKPTKFSVWGAKVLCGIGKLPETVMSRSIPLVMRRKLPHESIEPLRHAKDQFFEVLAAKLARFALDASNAVLAERPVLPTELGDRAQDNWEPLFAIASVAGGEWPEYARTAAMKLSSVKQQPMSIGVELLADIQDIFAIKNEDRISSDELVRALCEDTEKRWVTFNKGFPITPAKVARLLGEFQIVSSTHRFGHKTAKGYLRTQFGDAFARYVPVLQEDDDPVTPSQPNRNVAGAVTASSHVTACDVTLPDNVTVNTSGDGHCDGVTSILEDDDDVVVEVTL